jgi:putative membrane protein
VQVQTRTTAAVGSNGAAFAPYFIALSLWVGCTLTTFIFPYLLIPESARGTRQGARVLRKFAVPAVYVVAQALLVMLGVHLLGVPFLHPGLAVLTAVLASLTFMLLVLALNLLLGAAGRLLALVLLVIQLAASGGSYPIELSSPFFRWLHAYIPVTDAISAMRYALFGSYEGQYGLFMARMGLVALVSLAVALVSRRRWMYIADDRFRSPLVLDVG